MEFLKKRVAKKKLLNAFNISGLYYSAKWKGETIKKLPTVLDVRFSPDKTVYVFRLPHGVDPSDIPKKEYVFRSIFGDILEFKGKGTSKQSLVVYNTVHYGSYHYNFEELQEVMKKFNLPIIAGKDINGKYYCYDMTTNPHLLIAGETGSGKSVMLRAIVTSLIQHFRTGGLQLHLCDLKRSEFHLFRNIDIVEGVLTDKKDVAKCVAWFHKQLEKRGDLLDSYELSHIDEYNELAEVKKQDYLVLCIDEFSILRDLKETMEQLIDISSLGRALGIYLILSTQRPDRNIIDGLMKANLTVRYAFRHADKLNSRITLGEGAKGDASQIDEEDKGKFFMRYSGCHYLQSPYLPIKDEKDKDGNMVKGAKTLLEPFKTKVRFDGDIIDMESEEVEGNENDKYTVELLEDSKKDFAPLFEEEDLL